MKANRFFLYASICLIVACHSHTASRGVISNELIADSIRQMSVSLARDLAEKGPGAWLAYFDKGPDFFMASDGQLIFKDYPSSRLFIENILVKTIRKINLQFGSLRIEPLNDHIVSLGTGFHEDLTDTSGKILSVDGYLTALIENSGDGWKFRNLHWSLAHSK